MLSEQQANRAIELYADTVRRICMVHLKNQADSEDIFQTVFLKYLLRDQPFENEQHEKAWMIRVTINACKDLLKSPWRQRSQSLDVGLEVPAPQAGDGSVLEAVNQLPPHYRAVIYLFYFLFSDWIHGFDPKVPKAKKA